MSVRFGTSKAMRITLLVPRGAATRYHDCSGVLVRSDETHVNSVSHDRNRAATSVVQSHGSTIRREPGLALLVEFEQPSRRSYLASKMLAACWVKEDKPTAAMNKLLA